VAGLLVGRWWALLVAPVVGAWIALVEEVEVPGWILGVAYGALAAVAIGAGVTLRRIARSS
jgi:hypothetical protein